MIGGLGFGTFLDELEDPNNDGKTNDSLEAAPVAVAVAGRNWPGRKHRR